MHVTAKDERTGKAKDVRVRCQHDRNDKSKDNSNDSERESLLAAIKAAGEKPKGTETVEALRAWNARIRRRAKK